MRSKVEKLYKTFFDIDAQERAKVFYLSLTFFLVIGAYTITRDIKNSIFMSVVGKEYIPWAKLSEPFILIPLILYYSRMVDQIRRYQLLSYYSIFFGVVGLIFTFLIGHPTIGIANTHSSPFRLFGWLFYFFVEAFAPFVVSVFWAFANSVSSPTGAKKTYGLIVSASKVGGMLTAGIGWYLFSLSATANHPYLSDVVTHQLIVGISSCMLLLIPLVILLLMKNVPGYLLHGYEAAYQLEKQKKKEETHKTGLFSGLQMLIKYPYVLGIFGMVFFYEVISTVMGYLRLGVAQENAANISDISRILFEMVFKTHAIGFLISMFGTRIIHEKMSTRTCLILVPTLTGLFLLYFMFVTTPSALVNAFVALKAIHYAFSWPIRESLYIPTVKDIKFKSKSWIDAFGSKLAKTAGSSFSIGVTFLVPSMVMPIHSFFFAFLIGGWFITALLLGKRFDYAVEHNEVIGSEHE